jgi:hypothetical protein
MRFAQTLQQQWNSNPHMQQTDEWHSKTHFPFLLELKYLIPSKFCDLLAIKVYHDFEKKRLVRPWNSKITHGGKSFELEPKAITHYVVNNRVSTLKHCETTWNENLPRKDMNIGPSFHLISRNLTAHWKENVILKKKFECTHSLRFDPCRCHKVRKENNNSHPNLEWCHLQKHYVPDNGQCNVLFSVFEEFQV